MRNEPGESEWMVSLEGTWSFQWSPDPWSRPVDFYQRDFDASHWSPLSSSFELATQRLRSPALLKHQVSFSKGSAPRVPGHRRSSSRATAGGTRLDPTGAHFRVPDSWSGRLTFLHFDGVDSAFNVWVNEHKVGFAKDSRTPVGIRYHAVSDTWRKLPCRRGLSVF